MFEKETYYIVGARMDTKIENEGESKMLSWSEVEEILEGLTDREIVEKAYENYSPSMASGIAAIDLETGDFFGFSLTEGEEYRGPYLVICKVDQNLDIEAKDIFSEEELSNHLIGETLQESNKLSDCEMRLRELNYLVDNFEIDFDEIRDQYDLLVSIYRS